MRKPLYIPKLRDYQSKKFWERVEKTEHCWFWRGYVTPGGYGSFSIWSGGKCLGRKVHRIAYSELVGPIPEGLDLLHRCDVRHCVNPGHLVPGTNADNVKDRDAKGRQASLRGEANGSSKLTEKQVLAIRDIYSRGILSQEEIGQLAGVSQVAIGAIVRRDVWFHL